MLVSNRMTFCCYRADPCKCCRWRRTMDILIFPAIGRRSPVACPESQRSAVRLLFGCLFPQVDALPGSDGDPGNKAADTSDGWDIGMSDWRSGPVRFHRAAEALAW